MNTDDMNKVLAALRLANDCTFADEVTEGAKEYLRKELVDAIALIERRKIPVLKEDI